MSAMEGHQLDHARGMSPIAQAPSNDLLFHDDLALRSEQGLQTVQAARSTCPMQPVGFARSSGSTTAMLCASIPCPEHRKCAEALRSTHAKRTRRSSLESAKEKLPVDVLARVVGKYLASPPAASDTIQAQLGGCLVTASKRCT
eukprot:CAMPEP_0169253594 /NCGR_PEP_ID=MMETSP1016-20121227/38685_1 /TAXON_ID=342587 /ORGANISM="Karlodinium micrum, Strain CCMP2283" /LENGTH=143 /DNA_ID=CAMNT_0009334919 /DNA_START=504 /DNA_END=935 /DNA_ORIENTATION=-